MIHQDPKFFIMFGTNTEIGLNDISIHPQLFYFKFAAIIPSSDMAVIISPAMGRSVNRVFNV